MTQDVNPGTVWTDEASAHEKACADWAKLMANLQHKYGLGPKPEFVMTIKSQPEDLGAIIVVGVKRTKGRRDPLRFDARFVPTAAPYRSIILNYQKWQKRLLSLANDYRVEMAAADERELAGRLMVSDLVVAAVSASRSPWAVTQ